MFAFLHFVDNNASKVYPMNWKDVAEFTTIIHINKQDLGECIPPPIWKFLASSNRKSMGQSGSLMIILYPDYEVNEAEN